MSDDEYDRRRKRLKERIQWTPFSQAEISRDIYGNSHYVRKILNGYGTSRPALDQIEDWLDKALQESGA